MTEDTLKIKSIKRKLSFKKDTQYIAMDADGTWHEFNFKPEYNSTSKQWLVPTSISSKRDYNSDEYQYHKLFNYNKKSTPEKSLKKVKQGYQLKSIQFPEGVEVPYWAKYFAMDQNGDMYFYNEPPILNRYEWKKTLPYTSVLNNKPQLTCEKVKLPNNKESLKWLKKINKKYYDKWQQSLMFISDNKDEKETLLSIKRYCPHCSGSGKIENGSGHGAFGESETYYKDCPTCHSDGYLQY